MKEKMLAWMVQAYTALGLVTGLLALRAAIGGDMRSAFIWLAFSIIIDATDGPMSRFFRSSDVLPRFHGRKLDDIVDYFNYVIIPALILVRADMLPSGGWGWATVPLIASAYGFCQENAKTPDGCFTGFPSYWNIAVFYLYLLNFGQTACLIIVLALAILVFVPIKYIDPFKTKPLRRLTVPLTVLWAICAACILFLMPGPNRLLVRISFLYPCYYLLASFWINFSWKSGA